MDMNKNKILFDEVGTVFSQVGIIIEEKSYKEWGFKTKNEIYSSDICSAIDELLNIVTQDGDKFRIIIEKVDD